MTSIQRTALALLDAARKAARVRLAHKLSAAYSELVAAKGGDGDA